ncbi:MAG: phospholipase D-like domain-containing protein [Halobacteriales archaeon]
MLAVAVLAVLLLSPAAPAVGDDAPRIVEVYPNPVPTGDVGEYVLVEVSEPTSTAGWYLEDDAGQWARPEETTVEGRVALSRHPSEAARVVDHPVLALDGPLQLANRGQSVTLSVNGTLADRVSYPGRAPEARRWNVTDRRWVPLAATNFSPTRGIGATTAFVLPDAPGPVVAHLERARERIRVGAYTLASPPVVDALLAAHDRGVDVAVHAEGRPVGGIPASMADALDRLDAAGVPVTLHGGPYARWGYHHAKYAVVDDRLLVATENWKPSGLGGRANRGWGVVVENASLADAAVDLFEADASWRDARRWGAVRDAVDPVDVDPADGRFAARHTPLEVDRAAATLLVGPEAVEAGLVEAIRDADERLDVLQMSVGGRTTPPVREAIAAARRGVDVRVLLSGSWEVAEENRRFADEMAAIAEAEDLDLAVELAGPNARFTRIHAKGLVVDGERVLLGSVNWNNHSIRENRELLLAIDDPTVADYFTRAFEADWPGPERWTLRLGLLAAMVAAGAAVAAHARRLRVEGD